MQCALALSIATIFCHIDGSVLFLSFAFEFGQQIPEELVEQLSALCEAMFLRKRRLQHHHEVILVELIIF